MKKEFCLYEQALALKELGFDEPCFGWWFTDDEMLIIEKSKKSTSENIIQAPTFSQAFRFFNEKYGLYHYNIRRDYYISEDGVRSYDDIELECLKKLIEIVKEKK